MPSADAILDALAAGKLDLILTDSLSLGIAQQYRSDFKPVRGQEPINYVRQIVARYRTYMDLIEQQKAAGKNRVDR